MRLDRFVVSQLPEISRTRIRALLDEGRILVDDLPARPSHQVEPGETVTVQLPEIAPAGVRPEPIPLEILYEDKYLAVVNKPTGMIVHPGAGADEGTLVAALLNRFGADGLSTIGAPLRPGIVHRLDKDTSGVIVIARTDEAHQKLVEEFRERRVEKRYVALLHGLTKTDSGTIDLPVARDLHRRSRMTARRREGRVARTDWHALFRVGAFTFVEASIHTGRTHQIRVHFSALGWPVVGDTVYGAPRRERVGTITLPELNRNFLHAYRIAFAHPVSSKRIEVRAPLPMELAKYLNAIVRAAHSDAATIDAALKPYL